MVTINNHNNKLTISISCVMFGQTQEQLQEVFSVLAVAVDALAETMTIESHIYLIDNYVRLHESSNICQKLAAWVNSNNLFSHVSSIAGQGNVGFGAGHNLAIKAAGSDYHIILNPDVWVEKLCLVEGVPYLSSHSDVVMVAPAAKEINGDTQYIAKRYPSVLVLGLRAFAPNFIRCKLLRIMHHYELRDHIPAQKPLNIEIASGCFMLTKTAALKNVGGFNPKFFLYFEDYDLCLRLNKQYRIVHLPKMKIVHSGGGAAKKGLRHMYYFIKSAIKFFNIHGWRWS